MLTETFQYVSSADMTGPLLADVCFGRTGKPKPLVVVMHGYSGCRKDVAADIHDLALRGVVAVAPDMRGRGGSAGRWDSGGLDVHDILDAVVATFEKYAGEVDTMRLNIVGYSGGGGNAIACMVRFPDLFRTAVSFFGISNYGWWYKSKGRPDCNDIMEKVLGGRPDQIPEVYEARNFIPAAANACCGRLHFFWDEEETQCPPAMVEEWLSVHRAAGLENALTHVSRKSDVRRWIHAYRTVNADLKFADDIFLADFVRQVESDERLPACGRLVVPGYLVTRHFQVWIEDGQRGKVVVEYDLRGRSPVVKVVENPGGYSVYVRADSPLARLGRTAVNGRG